WDAVAADPDKFRPLPRDARIMTAARRSCTVGCGRWSKTNHAKGNNVMATHGKRSSPASLIAAACLFAVPAIAAAQSDYPNRPVKIIASVGAGTVADAVPRIIADKLSTRWGQAFVVENRPGGANNIGAEAAARAEADGYTLLAAPPTPLV